MPIRAPSLGTSFALAIVLAAIGALTIPRAGADDAGNLSSNSVEADNAAETTEHQTPLLRQPLGWQQTLNSSSEQRQRQDSQDSQAVSKVDSDVPVTNVAVDLSPANDLRDALSRTAAPHSANHATQVSRSETSAQTAHTDQTQSPQAINGQDVASETSLMGSTSSRAQASPNATEPGAHPPWTKTNLPSGAPSQELPELLTRDWSDAPNRSLRGRSELATETGISDRGASSLVDSLLPTASGLAIVIGLFLLCTWVVRKKLPRMVGGLPADVFEILGKTPLDKKHRLHLVRCGGKLALISVAAGGIETVLEIDNPDDVTRITGMCHELKSGSASANFRDVLSELNNESSRGWSRSGRSKRGTVS
ncbi:MAG: flagellar biosynthetic protein FliO [Pirellulales bacterium]|nr:flagellar biosynthetic protein FliO [Pirellulales bacterium]